MQTFLVKLQKFGDEIFTKYQTRIILEIASHLTNSRLERNRKKKCVDRIRIRNLRKLRTVSTPKSDPMRNLIVHRPRAIVFGSPLTLPPAYDAP